MTKKRKDKVDYSPGKEAEHCGPLSGSDVHYCEHFITRKTTESGICEVVQGPINRRYWCKLYRQTSDA